MKILWAAVELEGRDVAEVVVAGQVTAAVMAVVMAVVAAAAVAGREPATMAEVNEMVEVVGEVA